jgi:hypothetical protein
VISRTDIADGSLVRVGILPDEGESFVILKEDLEGKGCTVVPYAVEESITRVGDISIDSVNSKTKEDYISERIESFSDKYDKSLLRELLNEVIGKRAT